VKNLSLILNGILFIAVGYLYYNEYAGVDDDQADEGQNGLTTGNQSIAYVNSDTLFTNYNYYEEVSKALGEKRNKLEQEYIRRAEGLQKQIEDYQRTVNNMTIAQARAIEEDLGKKRQNLMQYQENITLELRNEEATMNQVLYEKVAAFLKNYGDNNNLQVVLTYSAGSGLLYANDALDITPQVISGLNELHNGALEAEPADTTATK